MPGETPSPKPVLAILIETRGRWQEFFLEGLWGHAVFRDGKDAGVRILTDPTHDSIRLIAPVEKSYPSLAEFRIEAKYASVLG